MNKKILRLIIFSLIMIGVIGGMESDQQLTVSSLFALAEFFFGMMLCAKGAAKINTSGKDGSKEELERDATTGRIFIVIGVIFMVHQIKMLTYLFSGIITALGIGGVLILAVIVVAGVMLFLATWVGPFLLIFLEHFGIDF